MQIHRDVIFSSAKSIRYEFIVQHVKTLLKPQSTPDRGLDFTPRKEIVRKNNEPSQKRNSFSLKITRAQVQSLSSKTEISSNNSLLRAQKISRAN